MRWKYKTWEEKKAERTDGKLRWQRFYAWFPLYDCDSRTAYWMEYVWGKRRAKDNDNRAPWIWEYRGGVEAPELKLEPPQTLPGNIAPIRTDGPGFEGGW